VDKKGRGTKTKNQGGNGKIVVLSPIGKIDGKENKENGESSRVIFPSRDKDTEGGNDEEEEDSVP